MGSVPAAVLRLVSLRCLGVLAVTLPAAVIGIVLLADTTVITGIVVAVTAAIPDRLARTVCDIGHELTSVVHDISDCIADIPGCIADIPSRIADKILGVIANTAAVCCRLCTTIGMHRRYLRSAGCILT